MDVADISDESGTVFLVIDFDSTGTGDTLTISNEVNKQPIVFDFFSFGIKNSNDVNNSIYRFELEETSDNSATFDGSIPSLSELESGMEESKLSPPTRTGDVEWN